MWMKGELIDKKVNDNCRFVQKNKIRAETRVRILVTFHHVTLIISNEKFQFQSQSECENLKCLLLTLSFQNPYFRFTSFRASPSLRDTTFRELRSIQGNLKCFAYPPLLQKPTTTLRSIQGKTHHYTSFHSGQTHHYTSFHSGPKPTTTLHSIQGKSLCKESSAITIAIMSQRSCPRVIAVRRCLQRYFISANILHYRLLVPLRFSNLRVVEKFLEDGVYYSLAELGADAFELIPHLLWIFQIHDIEGYLITDAFSDDLLRYTYGHSIFFHFFRE